MRSRINWKTRPSVTVGITLAAAAMLCLEPRNVHGEVKPTPATRSVYVVLDNTQSMVLAAKKEAWDGFAKIYKALPPHAPVTLLLLDGRGVNKHFRAHGKASAIRRQVFKIREHYFSSVGRGARGSSELRCSDPDVKESRFLDAIRYGVVDDIAAVGGAQGRYRHEAHVFGDLVEESCDNVLRKKIDMKSDPSLSRLEMKGKADETPAWPEGLRVHLHILHDPEQLNGPRPDDLEHGWRKLLPLGGFRGDSQYLVVTKGR